MADDRRPQTAGSAPASRQSGEQSSGPVDVRVLDLQRRAGNRAVAHLMRVVARERASSVPPPTDGDVMERFGVVSNDTVAGGGVNLRADANDKAGLIGHLDYNDHFVVRRAMAGNWYYAVVTDGPMKGSAGYVSGVYVNIDMPPSPSEPDASAKLYRIKEGERAYPFVRRYYGSVTEQTGTDERFFTNVLRAVNDQKNRRYIVVKQEVRTRNGFSEVVDDPQLVAGGQIWMPSEDYALSLKGTVSSGSFARDVVEKIKDFGNKLLGAIAFGAGLIVGAIESLKDLFVGLFDFVWQTLKSLGGNLIDAAKGIWGLITDSRQRNALFGAMDQGLQEMIGPKVSRLRRAFNWGRIVGYATMEVISFVITAGAVKAGQWGTRLQKVFKVIEKGSEAIRAIVKAGKVKLAAQAGKIAARVAPVAKVAATLASVGAKGKALLGALLWGGRKIRQGLTSRWARRAERRAARKMVARLEKEEGKVVVNIGGAGAPHEPKHAINLNPNKVASRRDIPNHIAEPGERIGEIFDPGKIDEVVGYGLPHDTLDWPQIAAGSKKVLKSGGKVSISLRWAHPEEAAKMFKAFTDAGFQGVRKIGEALIEATK